MRNFQSLFPCFLATFSYPRHSVKSFKVRFVFYIFSKEFLSPFDLKVSYFLFWTIRNPVAVTYDLRDVRNSLRPRSQANFPCPLRLLSAMEADFFSFLLCRKCLTSTFFSLTFTGALSGANVTPLLSYFYEKISSQSIFVFCLKRREILHCTISWNYSNRVLSISSISIEIMKMQMVG